MTVYVDTDALKATLTLSNTSYANDDIDAVAVAASAAIEQAQGRTYGKSAEDETRYYTPTVRGVLWIDDLAELTSLRVQTAVDAEWDTWAGDTHYRLAPFNAPAHGQPYTQIQALPGSVFPCYSYARVEVVGKFGWPTPPAGVVEAATLVATQLLKRRRDTPFPVMAVADQAAYITKTDPQVAALLHGLSRRKLLV